MTNTIDCDKKINRTLFWLLAISAAIRALAASAIEFGNDEVYYWTYALYPDWSHFDHPPMVGWMIQIFSLNLLFDSEFFIRLSSILFMTIDTYLIFRIGKEISDALTGLYAALLYTASIYAFVITGIFILPDTPLSLFWLLSFWMAVRYIKNKEQHNRHLLLMGLFAGLATLSKYTGACLWIGMGFYILLFDRKQLRNPILYLSMLLTLLCCLPILYWNLENDFFSFSFHGGRVGLFGKPRLDYFGTELAGELFYNNPVNFILIIIAVVAAFKRKIGMDRTMQRLILCTALPLITAFLFFSLTRPTLPHWNAPAYNLLLLLVACQLRDKHPKLDNRIAIPRSIVAALCTMLLTVGIGIAEINTGFIPLDRHNEPEMLGRDDFTMDMYGWRQLKTKFDALRKEKISEGVMHEDDGIVANQWFPLANLDYYVARPLGMKVMGLGYPSMLHKYLWINEARGGFKQGESYWFLSDSHYMKDPYAIYQWAFSEIAPIDTIQIERCGKPAKNFFVYSCKKMHSCPPTLQEIMAKSASKE